VPTTRICWGLFRIGCAVLVGGGIYPHRTLGKPNPTVQITGQYKCSQAILRSHNCIVVVVCTVWFCLPRCSVVVFYPHQTVRKPIQTLQITGQYKCSQAILRLHNCIVVVIWRFWIGLPTCLVVVFYPHQAQRQSNKTLQAILRSHNCIVLVV